MTTLTVDDELADRLEDYGDTRNEQLEAVLNLARSAQGTGRSVDSTEFEEKLTRGLGEYHGDSNVEEVIARLTEIQGTLDRMPENLASELR